MATIQTERTYKIILFLDKCMTVVVRCMLMKQTKDVTPTGTQPDSMIFQHFKTNNQSSIFNPNGMKRHLIKTQIDLLSPPNKVPNLDDWDISLVIMVLLSVCKLPLKVKKELEKLKELRNKLSHAKNEDLTNQQYEDDLKDLKRIRDRCLIWIGDVELTTEMNKVEEETQKGSIKLREDSIEHIKAVSDIQTLQGELYQWIEDKDEIIEVLNVMANKLDKHFERIGKAKLGGSAAGIVGGAMAAVGFGLSFFTCGASLGLSVAGGIISGAGGLTVGGTVITDAILSVDIKEDTKKAMKTYCKKVEYLKKRCIDVGAVLGKYGIIDKQLFSWVNFLAKFIFFGIGRGVEGVGCELIANTVIKSLRIASYFDDVAKSRATAGAATFKAIGSTAGKGFHIAGGVFGVIFIPVDIYTLYDSALDVHQKNPNKVSEYIRLITNNIADQCPTKQQVDDMIDDTLKRLEMKA